MSEQYKGWTIEHNPKPIPLRDRDWDGYRDEQMVCCASVEDVKAEIDEIEGGEDYPPCPYCGEPQCDCDTL